MKLTVTEHARIRLFQRFNVTNSSLEKKVIFDRLITKVRDVFQYRLIELQPDGNEIREIEHSGIRIHCVYNPIKKVVITVLDPIRNPTVKEKQEQKARRTDRINHCRDRQRQTEIDHMFDAVPSEAVVTKGNKSIFKEYDIAFEKYKKENIKLRLLIEQLRLDIYDLTVENDKLNQRTNWKNIFKPVLFFLKKRH